MSSYTCWPFRRSESTNQPINQTSNTAEDGLKLLYEGETPQVDIVAVHGQGGHREKSWTTESGVNWLQSLLPVDLPNTRIHTWGYASTYTDDPETSQDTSERLVSELFTMRKMTGTLSRPIIFIAHSFGGTIVKSALLFSHNSREGRTLCLRNISLSTHGVIFMGTPELESRLSGLQALLDSNVTAETEQTDAQKEARWMLDVLQQYSALGTKFKTLYAYESLSSPSLDNPSMSQRLTPSILIDATHGDMIKFGSSLDEGYVKIKENIDEMINSATES
ncbi:uncharacterized protein N7498_004260 [Penicillium cinerascens]|uniref:Uncharacterized protein n=1 Tax=Penicillium cinerascens TaxID=70096 RepID=A0A9W9T7W9_9EURO|nr:uncharacterized protein N7498_004260 [Penicillium cinerascens]KAJ5212614.1 hypothetical protein N7498_004260 [Penicillium cinerascens]